MAESTVIRTRNGKRKIRGNAQGSARQKRMIRNPGGYGITGKDGKGVTGGGVTGKEGGNPPREQTISNGNLTN